VILLQKIEIFDFLLLRYKSIITDLSQMSPNIIHVF
jgi:hypothetical protein